MLLSNRFSRLFPRRGQMLLRNRIGCWMNAFSSLQGYCDEVYVDWGGDSCIGADLDNAFYAWLTRRYVSLSISVQQARQAHQCRRDARISYQEILIGSSRHPHEGTHIPLSNRPSCGHESPDPARRRFAATFWGVSALWKAHKVPIGPFIGYQVCLNVGFAHEDFRSSKSWSRSTQYVRMFSEIWAADPSIDLQCLL